MIAYASRTGTRRNLAALRGANWRLLVSATGVHRTEGLWHGARVMPYSGWIAVLPAGGWPSPAPTQEMAWENALELLLQQREKTMSKTPKIRPMKLLLRLLPAITKVVKATRKGSDGGKRITPDERDEILGALFGEVEEVIGDFVEKHVGDD